MTWYYWIAVAIAVYAIGALGFSYFIETNTAGHLRHLDKRKYNEDRYV